MRITTGRFGGRTIATAHTLDIRPATDRVRQTIYNILAHRIDLEGIAVLDLFAGSGSLGFEALSRGARHVTFVENNPEAVRYLEKNEQALGCQAHVTIIQADVMGYLQNSQGSFTVVFADPPYDFAETARIPTLIFEKNLVSPAGFLVIEHSTALRYEKTSMYTTGPEKKFGRTLVTFFQHRIPS
jgi:16S rRNA (guanine966-N2)-methyltransferase